MRPKIVTALCLLAVGACAHQQQPREEASSQARARDTQMTSSSPSAADQAAYPGSTSNSGIVSQGMPDATMPQLGVQQPAGVTPESSEASQALGATSPGAGQAQPSEGSTMSDQPPAGADSKELARASAEQDIALRERIQSTLGTAPNLSYSARHVGVTVEKSEVTLSGDVRNERERKEVADLVQQIQGVRRVKNQISAISQTNVRGTTR